MSQKDKVKQSTNIQELKSLTKYPKQNIIMSQNTTKKIVTPRLLQKGISENFDFHVTLRHH
jgi:hypothetical protein